MSRKMEKNYMAVLQALDNSLEKCGEVHGDYEFGAWFAICQIFPTVAIKGCIFHWTQAVWRHVQSCGLSKAYKEQQAVHSYTRQLLFPASTTHSRDIPPSERKS